MGEAVAAAQATFSTGIQTTVEGIYYSSDLLQSEFAQNLMREQTLRGIPCYDTSAAVFSSLAEKENPQGILAVVRLRRASLAELTPDTFSFGVALVAPQDPGNVGTILRALDAVGGDGLLLLDSSADPTHPNVLRASMGTLFWYPLVSASFADFARWAKRQGYNIYGTSAHGSRDYRAMTTYERPLILLLGNEREGLTIEQRAVCEEVIGLPMHGRASSLNLAVAAGVLLYAIEEKITAGPASG